VSIKALQRRAREARYWLGQRALPLWADVGFLRDGGALAALEMNHRPGEAPMLGDADDQVAIADLFALAERVGFDAERASLLRSQALDAAAKQEKSVGPNAGDPARSLRSACDDLRLRLMSFASAEGEDAILARLAASRAFDTLMDDFLTPEGGWIVGYDAQGLPVARDIPAKLAAPIAAALSPLLPLGEP